MTERSDEAGRGTRHDALLRAALATIPPPPAGDCPHDDEWVAWACGTVPPPRDDRLRAHLAECAACVRRTQEAHAFVATMQPPAPRRSAWGSMPVPRRRLLALIPVAAAIVVAALVGWGTFARDPRAAAWRAVQIPRAPYPVDADADIVWRDAPQSPPDLGAAVALYAAGDLDAAERALARLVEAAPGEPSARFYLGVTRLAAGRPERALDDLAVAAAGSDAALAATAAWYRALAFGKAGRYDAADAALHLIAEGEGRHREAARELLRVTGRTR